MTERKPNWDRMTEVGNKFIGIHKTLDLDKDNVNFGRIGVDGEGCGTVACHGGWGAVIFKVPHLVRSPLPYIAGGDAIAEFLGFKDECDYPGRMKDNFASWAAINPDIWGNEHGCHMFTSTGYLAFGFWAGDMDECTLEDIGKHYLEAAERGRKEETNDGAS